MDENDDVTYDEGSLSSDLAAAWEETAATEEAPDDNTPEPVPPGAAEPGEPGSADPGTAEQPSADDNGVAGTDTPAEAPPADDTPPVSLPPAAREVWKDTPAAMKAAIAKREKDYEAGIVKYAGDAKRAQQMDQVLSQHQHYFAMTNEPVGKTVNDLLSVASNLYMGPPHVKAQIVAGLINQ